MDEVQAMMIAGFGAWLLISAISATETKAPAPQAHGQLVVRRQIIVRTMRVRPNPGNRASVTWREAKGVKCLPAGAIAGAALFGPNSVDFVLKDKRRIRAQLNAACPALDYYQGFYVTPGEDGRICVDRDFVRSRMGRECGIERLKMLVPIAKR